MEGKQKITTKKSQKPDKKERNTPQKAILLFDGVCNLCNRLVHFVIKRDPQAHFLFASLQSETGQQLLRRFGLPTDNFNSFVLIENGQYFTASDAALKLAKRLPHFWKILYIFILLPRPLRNAAYRLIARKRYCWFGQKKQCLLPTAELAARFI